jgi:hypothetical protein
MRSALRPVAFHAHPHGFDIPRFVADVRRFAREEARNGISTEVPDRGAIRILECCTISPAAD